MLEDVGALSINISSIYPYIMGEKDWDTCRLWKRSQKCMRMWKLKFKNCNKVTRYFANKIWTVYPKNQEKVICFAKNWPKFNQIIFDSVFWKYFQGQENVFMTFLWKIITKIIVIKSKCGIMTTVESR